MRPALLTVVAAATVAISGCASSRYAQEINRLRADVNMLNERLSQMEHASFNQPSAAWPSTESQPQASGETASPSKAKSQPGTTASAKPSKREIQQALKNAGFYQGPVDGRIGPQTRSAIKEFQRINGLKADGVVGRQTWEKLAPYLELAANTGETAKPASVIK